MLDLITAVALFVGTFICLGTERQFLAILLTTVGTGFLIAGLVEVLP